MKTVNSDKLLPKIYVLQKVKKYSKYAENIIAKTAEKKISELAKK